MARHENLQFDLFYQQKRFQSPSSAELSLFLLLIISYIYY